MDEVSDEKGAEVGDKASKHRLRHDSIPLRCMIGWQRPMELESDTSGL